MPGVSEETLLAVAAACGFGSLHPVSRAVVAEALARGIAAPPPTEVARASGARRDRDGGRRQPRCSVAERCSSIWASTVATARTMTSRRYGWPTTARASAASSCAISRGPRRGDALDAMRALGIDRLVLLTGDRAAAAREVGEALGMDEVIAEVLPAQKLEVGPRRAGCAAAP